MTFAQMREMFEAYTGTGDEVDSAQLALWFNEAQLDLAYKLAPVQAVDIVLDDDGLVRLEEDWLTVVGCDQPYSRTLDGRLRLEGSSTEGKLYVRRIPTALTGLDGGEESELPKALQYLPPLFAASRYWDKESEGDGEESNHASKWLTYYYQGKNLAKARLELVRSPVEGWIVQ